MIIESIKRLEKKPGKFIALFEDGTQINVSAVQIADFGLYSGRELSDDEFLQLREELCLSSSKARAIRILGNRDLSAREVERRLVDKGEPQEIAQKTVRWLESIGAINDGKYAVAIVKHYCAKGYGNARIKDELYRRGIARDMWEDAFCDALSGIDNMGEAVNDFLEKKLKGSRDPADIRRATDTLCRRGFSYEEARTAVSQYFDTIEDNEE